MKRYQLPGRVYYTGKMWILGGAFEQDISRGGGRGAQGASQYVPGNYMSFMGTNLTGVEGIPQFISLA